MFLLMSPVIAIGVGVYGAENCRGYRAQCGSKGDADDVARKLAVDNIPAWSNIMVGRIPFVLAVCYAWRVGLDWVSIRRNIELMSPLPGPACTFADLLIGTDTASVLQPFSRPQRDRRAY